MPVHPRAVAARFIASSPVHRVLPKGSLKTYATLKYHGERSTSEEIAKILQGLGGIPTHYLSTAMIAARAAFRSGLDDQVRDTLDVLRRRFPESPEVLKLQAELFAFGNDYDKALATAHRARLLDPPAAAIAAQTIKYSYHALDTADADQHTIAMVRRFPWSAAVLWAAAKACISAEQYDRFETTWTEAIADRDNPVDLLRAARPLATAAARAHEVERGIVVLRRAITAMHEGVVPPEQAQTLLAGRGAWSAIADICEVLDAAEVPFFFAAGTALGFERIGRPLSDDGDIDVGIFEADFDPERLTKLVAAHPRFVVDPHPLSKKVHIRHRGGSPIDLFRYYTENDQVWHDGVFVRWWNSPFEIERRDFEGLSIPLPSNPDRYLTENYADWRVPNSNFDSFTSEAPNCVVHWDEYQRLHYMRRAFKAMTTNDRTAATQDLRQADESTLAELIGQAA